MNKADFVEILGVQIPLRGIEFVTCMPRSSFYDAVTDLMVADSWREFFDFLKADTSIFTKTAERKVIPIDSGVRRQLFTYGDSK